MSWLKRLICRTLGHRWKLDGGVTCLYGEPDCGQPMFRCARCGQYDYSGPGSLGRDWCYRNCREGYGQGSKDEP